MTSSAYGQIEAGGVSSEAFPPGTTWYAGEGLKKGDFLLYPSFRDSHSKLRAS